MLRDTETESKVLTDEKLKAVSDYLQTMKYTKTPAALPKEIDDAESYRIIAFS